MAITMVAARPMVLVVEDEPLIREVLEKWLERGGWQVCSTGTAEGALELQERYNPGIVLCDVSLEGRDNGRDLAVKLVARNPQLAVIFATGGPSFDAPPTGMVGCLVKPYSHQQFKEQLSAAMQHIAMAN